MPPLLLSSPSRLPHQFQLSFHTLKRVLYLIREHKYNSINFFEHFLLQDPQIRHIYILHLNTVSIFEDDFEGLLSEGQHNSMLTFQHHVFVLHELITQKTSYQVGFTHAWLALVVWRGVQ